VRIVGIAWQAPAGFHKRGMRWLAVGPFSAEGRIESEAITPFLLSEVLSP
jgi:hypothetical protein